MLEKRQFYINGKWVAPARPHDFNVIDPSTEEPCAVISLGDQADTDAAVAAAKAALPAWSATPPAERLAYVQKILEIYQARSEEMARAMSLEMGAPIDMARNQQVGAGVWHIQNFITAFKDFEFIRPLGHLFFCTDRRCQQSEAAGRSFPGAGFRVTKAPALDRTVPVLSEEIRHGNFDAENGRQPAGLHRFGHGRR